VVLRRAVVYLEENTARAGSNSLGYVYKTCNEVALNQGHRRTRRGVGEDGRRPGLKNFRANSVFRATASCSKILNNIMKYISAQ